MKKIFLLFLSICYSQNVFAAAIPITYNITMDYNAITDQFENARITGGIASVITVNGSYPIQIDTAKDGIEGRNYGSVIGFTDALAFTVLRRTSSFFDLSLVNQNDNKYKVLSKNQLIRSYVNLFYNDGRSAYISSNYGCNIVTPYYTSSQQIVASANRDCSGNTTAMFVQRGGTFGGSRMSYFFDLNNNIKRYLSNPATKVGDYTGSVVYTGDSIVLWVNGGGFGPNTESYTFNFTINKKLELTSINFPNGKISTFNVKKTGSNYIGNSALNFNVDGVFNFSNKLNFQLTSANTINNKLVLRNGSHDIFYTANLINITTGKKEVFNSNNQMQQFNISSNNQFQGLFDFNFISPVANTPNGNYSDQLTMMVSIEL